MKKTGKRIVCWILSAMMLAGQVQAVFAEEETEITEQPEETEVVPVDTEFVEEPETVTEEPEEETEVIAEEEPEEIVEEEPEEIIEEVTETVYEAEADYTYTVTDGNAIITKYTGSESSVVIPDTLGGNPVTEIKGSAFYNNTGITSVRFPSTLTKIGSSAFAGCTSLSSVVFPDSVRNIQTNAFNKCPLENLVLPKYLADAETGAFANNPKLTSIFIPKTLNSSSSLFQKCDNLKNVTFEDGLGVIPNSLFSGLASLEKIVIPEGITKIGSGAFSNCENLKEVSLPTTLETINSSAFSGCASLTGIVFPDSLTTVQSNAFNKCPLENLVLPKYLADADAGAFANNPSLTSIFIPKTLKSDNSLFQGCENLKDVTFEEGITTVPANLFNGLKSLEKIVIPEGVTGIGSSAFHNCENLKKVSLPSTLKTIGSSVFNSCVLLTHIDIPDSVTNIGSYAFSKCPLSDLVLPENLADAEIGAFANNPSLTSVVIPKTLKSTSSLFGGCTHLKDVVFEEGMIKIPSNIFSGVSSLERVVIPEGITVIADGAFYNCTNLQYVSIADSVKSISKSAFSKCDRMSVRTNYDTYGVVYAIDNGKKYEAVNSHTSESLMLDRNVSQYYADPAGFMINGALPCTVVIGPKEGIGDLVDQTLTVYVPKDAEIDLGSISFNGTPVQTTFDEKTRKMVFAIGKSSGILRFNMQFNSIGTMDTYACFNARMNGKIEMDVIGSFNEVFTGVSISAPDKTSENKFEVKGLAPAGSQVEVSIDNDLQTTATAMKTGTWRTEVTLPDPQDHYPYTINAHVKNSDREEDTAEKMVIYSSGAPKLQSFVYDECKNGKVEKEYDLISNKQLRVFIPEDPYKFVIDFDNPESIDHVYVNSIKGTDVKKIEAFYDQKLGKYVAEGWFNDQRSYIPGKLTVTYSENRDVYLTNQMISNILPQKFEELEGLDVKYAIEGNVATAEIDLGKISSEFTKSTLKLTFKYLDKESGASVGDFFGNIEDIESFAETLIPGLDGKSSVYTKIEEFKEKPSIHTWNAVTGSFAGPTLDFVEDAINIRMDLISDELSQEYFDLSDKLMEFKSVKNVVKTFYDVAKIYQETDKMRDQIMWGTGTDEQKRTALKKLDKLHSDRAGFTVVTALGTAALGLMGTSPPVLIMSGLLAAMKIASDLIYDYRKDEVLAAAADMKIKTDPSGYVYDIDTDERLEGVKATAYWIEYDPENEQGMSDDEFLKPENKPADDEYGVVWNAEEYEQVNPQMTDENGRYQWDVPTGWWRVKYEKKDYLTTWSEWLPVPPPQLEVNIGLVPENRQLTGVTRIFGAGRWQTSLGIADELKRVYGVNKFRTVVLASGLDFPDALAGGYLAAKNNAPILIVSNKNAKSQELAVNYIRKNLVSGGKIYILGGVSAVSQDIENKLEGYDIERLGGSGRYETNMMILEEAGVNDEDILISTGSGYADSLSASAAGRPILLVSPKKGLSDEQRTYLRSKKGNRIYILGGEGAVSKEVEAELKSFGNEVKRLEGAGRYQTSVAIAEEFFNDAESAALAWGGNFPDGLCGGPLAAATGSPLILTKDNEKSGAAKTFAKARNIKAGYMLGGTSALADETAEDIFGEKPVAKEYE